MNLNELLTNCGGKGGPKGPCKVSGAPAAKKVNDTKPSNALGEHYATRAMEALKAGDHSLSKHLLVAAQGVFKAVLHKKLGDHDKAKATFAVAKSLADGTRKLGEGK